VNSNSLLLWQVLTTRGRLECSNSWTRARLLEHQQTELQTLRRVALERSPFYRRFHRGLEARPITELPVLTKAILMENFDELVTDPSVHLADVEDFIASDSQALFQNRYVPLVTSGSTGLRGVFLFDPEEWVTALANIARPMLWTGAKIELRHPPRAAMIASTAPSYYSARVGAALATRWMPSLRIDATEPLGSMVERLNRWQPQILAAYPNVLRELAQEQLAGRLRISVQHVGASASVLTADARRIVEQAWNVRVQDTYGATEYSPIATECRHGRMHLVEDGALIEIADERGPVPPGVAGSRVLLTVFGRRTQPLIRYELSDMLRSIEGQCECGRPFQLIDAIEGRSEEVLRFRSRAGGSVSIHPNHFHRLLEGIAVSGWQVIQDGDVLRVNLMGLRDANLSDVLARSIGALLELNGAELPLIEIREVAVLERGATGKAPLLIARRPHPAAL
jgi:phenylacetate-CoA ligase